MTASSDFKRVRNLHALLNPSRRTRIVDVGANPESNAVYGELLDAGLAEVWSFEPQLDRHQALLEMNKPNEHPLPYAIGDGKPGTLNIYKSHWFTSLLEPNPKFPRFVNKWARALTVVERVEVDTHALDDIKEIPGIDFLKIDIQGGEQMVFENAGNKLRDTLAVMTEVAAIALYKDQPLLDDQMRALRHHGFELHKFLVFKTTHAGPPRSERLMRRHHQTQLLDGDAIFIKHMLDLEHYGSEELKHLALLADSVFKSYNIVLWALHHLEKRGEVAGAAIDDYLDLVPHTLPRESQAQST